MILAFFFIALIILILHKIIKDRVDWNYIESINDFPIDRFTCYIDSRGYLRWRNSKKLCHRDIAYNYIYKKLYAEGKLKRRFSEYDVHHKDFNKLNNKIENLEILTREQHIRKHKGRRRIRR